MQLQAFAKINLALQVGPRRQDGFHDLCTLFQTVSLADTLDLELDDQLRLAVVGSAPTGPGNLVMRAAEALRARAGGTSGARIRLHKRIPMGAGLGGGSSDAAAALIGLDRLWDTRASADDLLALAGELGSDVPFFLLGGTALGLGRGERLFAVEELPERNIALVLPGVHIATGPAFAALDAIRRDGFEPGAGWRHGALWHWAPGCWVGLENDFELVVFEQQPALSAILGRLRDAGAELARLSGSGSALFGVFATEAMARAGVQAVESLGFDAELVRSLGRADIEAVRWSDRG